MNHSYLTPPSNKIIRFLSGLLGIHSRVIIEGGFQDDWISHHMDKELYRIPSEVNRIKIASYDLDLVATVRNNSMIPEELPHKKINQAELDYDFFFRIQRPTSILIEDGRIFYDTSLGYDRLESYLTTIADKYSYKRHEANNPKLREEIKQLTKNP